MDLIEGIVINQIKYQENSKIIYVLTKDSLKSLLVKSSCNFNSKNYSYSQELQKLNFGYNESKKNTFDILTSASIIETYRFIKNNYDLLTLAVDMLKKTYQTFEHVNNCTNLYELLSFCLDKMNCENIIISKYYYLIFKLKLLYLLGIGPNFKGCTKCLKKEVDYFSIIDGGLICKECLTNENNNKDLYKGDYITVMKLLYLGKFEVLSYEFIESIVNINDYFDSINSLINKYYQNYI